MVDRYQGRVVRSSLVRSGPAGRIIGLALIHLSLAFLAALATYGMDLDQLRERSAGSRAAAVAHDVLWFPHDAIIRSLPLDWVALGTPVTVTVLVLSSLLWGAAAYAVWRLVLPPRRPSPEGAEVAREPRRSR